jgi:hypothetical protein
MDIRSRYPRIVYPLPSVVLAVGQSRVAEAFPREDRQLEQETSVPLCSHVAGIEGGEEPSPPNFFPLRRFALRSRKGRPRSPVPFTPTTAGRIQVGLLELPSTIPSSASSSPHSPPSHPLFFLLGFEIDGSGSGLDSDGSGSSRCTFPLLLPLPFPSSSLSSRVKSHAPVPDPREGLSCWCQIRSCCFSSPGQRPHQWYLQILGAFIYC